MLPSSQEALSLLRHPAANRECRLGDTKVAYLFQRGQRKTIGLRIGPQGLSVRAPSWTPVSEVDAFIHTKADWVLTKLRQLEQCRHLTPTPLRWQSGAQVAYLGHTLTVLAHPSGAAGSAAYCAHSRELRVGITPDAPPEMWHSAVQAWLRREAERLLGDRLIHFAPMVGVTYQRWGLSNARTRWGSANSLGHLRLNWRLIHLPLELVDYVVVHELSHLREMNHGPRFWALVQTVLPDYDRRRRALKRISLAG